MCIDVAARERVRNRAGLTTNLGTQAAGSVDRNSAEVTVSAGLIGNCMLTAKYHIHVDCMSIVARPHWSAQQSPVQQSPWTSYVRCLKWFNSEQSL